MLRALVGIYVRHGKAYLPVIAQMESGPFLDIEPVYRVDLHPEALVGAIQHVLAAGHPRRPDPTRDELRPSNDPVLKATGARSWKELARTGASYSITWTDDAIRVEMSRLDRKGRWEWDPAKRRWFPPDAPLDAIVAVILEDIRSRPEVRGAATPGGCA